MKPGDEVVYTSRVALYGIGKIVRVLPDGRLRVRFPIDDFHEFHPHELETWEHWQKRAEKAKQRQAA